jgi:hypothetical protein
MLMVNGDDERLSAGSPDHVWDSEMLNEDV